MISIFFFQIIATIITIFSSLNWIDGGDFSVYILQSIDKNVVLNNLNNRTSISITNLREKEKKNNKLYACTQETLYEEKE